MRSALAHVVRALFVVAMSVAAQDEGAPGAGDTRTQFVLEFTMPLNPHPIVLTTASERHRAELLALAEPKQRRLPAPSCASHPVGWCVNPGTRAANWILALLLAAVRQG